MGSDDKKIKQAILRANQRDRRRDVRYEALEPRVLLSADLLPIDIDSTQSQALVDELVIDVDLDQVEEATKFVIEGLDPIAAPDTLVTGSDSGLGLALADQLENAERLVDDVALEQLAADAVIDAGQSIDVDAAPPQAAQQLMQQYWLDKLAGTALPTDANTSIVQELIVVDSAIDNYESLVAGLLENYRDTHRRDTQLNNTDVLTDANGVSDTDNFVGIDQSIQLADAQSPQTQGLRVLVLDSESDGLDQVTELLSGYENLAALHIFAHGAAGTMRLGNTTVNSETLSRRAAQFGSWQAAFHNDGDMLLYGCNVSEGEHGVDFVNQLAALTSTDIAASDDVTGSDGDWQLETKVGEVAMAGALQATSWQANLALVDQIPGITDLTEINDELLLVLQQLSALADGFASIELPAELGVTIDDFGFINDLVAVLQFANDAVPSATTIVGVVAELQSKLDAAIAATNLTGNLTVSAGFDNIAEELRFNLGGQLFSSVDSTIANISDKFQDAVAAVSNDPALNSLFSGEVLGIDLPTISGDLNLSSLLDFNVDFGLALGEYLVDANANPLSNSDAFIGLNGLDAELRLTASDLDASDLIPDNPNTISLGVEDAVLMLVANTRVSFANADTQKRQDLQSIIDSAAANLLSFDNNASFMGSLPVVAGISDFGELSQLGTPIILIKDPTIGDGDITVALDFIPGDDLKAALSGLFDGGLNLDFNSLNLDSLFPDLPFEIDGLDFVALGFQPILDALNGLFDFSVIGNALNDFYDLFDALTLFNGISVPGFSWDAPNLDWPGLFGVPDFDGFKLKFDVVLERLLPGFDLPALDFDAFKLAIADLDIADLRLAFSTLLTDLQAVFDFDLSVDFDFEELLASIAFELGTLPTLNTLSAYLQGMFPRLTGFDTNLGPLNLELLFDSLTKELQFDFKLDLHRFDTNIFSDGNIDALTAELDKILANIKDADFLSSLGLDTSDIDDFDFDLPMLPNGVPAFDLKSDIDLAFSIGASLANVLQGNSFNSASDGFFQLNTLDTALTISSSDLDISIPVLDQGRVNLDILPGTDISLGGKLAGSSTGRIAFADLSSLGDLVSLIPTVPFDSHLLFSLSGSVGGGLLDQLGRLGTPVIRLYDPNLLDNGTDGVGDFFGDLMLDLDFVLGDDLKATLQGLFDGGLSLDFNSLDLAALFPDLPFELDGLDFVAMGFQPILDALNGLFDFSVMGDALNDFYELFDAITLFKGIHLPNFDWNAPNLDWQGIFGVADFEGFKLKFDIVLERLIPGFDLPNLDFDAFKLNIADLGIANLRAGFDQLLTDLQVVFDFEFSLDFDFDELLAAINLHLGSLATLDTLSAYLQGMFPRLTGFDTQLGPLNLDILFDSLTDELRFDFDLSLHRFDLDIFSDDNIDALTAELNKILANIKDVDFLSSLGLDTSSLDDFDFNLPTLPAGVPAFDLRSDIDLAFSVTASLANVLQGNPFNSQTDGFFQLDTLDTALTISTSDLAFDITVLDDPTDNLILRILDGTDISLGGKLVGNSTGRVDFASLGNLSALVSLTPTVPFDSHLLFTLAGGLGGGVLDQISMLGTPVIRVYDPNLLDNRVSTDFFADLMLDLDFILGENFRATIGSLSSGFDLNLDGISLPTPNVDLPFDLDALLGDFFGDIVNKLKSLLDVDALSGLITDFLDLYDAISLFDALSLPNFDWSLLDVDPNINWQKLFGVADFTAFKAKFSAVIDRLLAVVDITIPDWDTLTLPDFQLAMANLSFPDFKIAFSELLVNLQAAFDFELSVDFDFDELLAAIEFHLGTLPTLTELGVYLSNMIVELSDLNVELGPLDIAVKYLSYDLPGGDVAHELRIEFATALAEAFRGLTFQDIADGLESTINEGLSALDGLGIGGQTIDLPDNINDILPGDFDPLVDLAASLDFAGALVLRVEDLFAGNPGELNKNDLFFEWTQFDSAVELTLRQLGITLGDDNFQGSLLDSAFIALPAMLNGQLSPSSNPRDKQIALFADPNNAALPTISDLAGELNWDADIGIDGFLPFDLSIAGFDLSNIGIPVVTLADDALGEGDPIDVDFDFLLSENFESTIRDVFAEIASGIMAATDAIDLSALGIPAIQSAVDDILAEISSINDLGQFVNDYFSLARAFNFDLTSGYAELGTLLGITAPVNLTVNQQGLPATNAIAATFDPTDAAHRELLRLELNTQNGTSIVSISESDLADYQAEIYGLLPSSNFDLSVWIDRLADLVGVVDASNFDDIRTAALNWFKSPASLKGLVNFVEANLPDTVSGESNGFSFAVDLDSKTLGLGLNISPSLSTTLQDIVGVLTNLVSGDSSSLTDILGSTADDFLPDLDDVAAKIELLADFNFAIDAIVDLADFSNFAIDDDVTISVNDFAAGFSILGDDLDFAIDLGGFGNIGVEDALLGFNIDFELLGLVDNDDSSPFNFSGTFGEFATLIGGGVGSLLPAFSGDYFSSLPFIAEIPLPGGGTLALDELVQPTLAVNDLFEYRYEGTGFTTIDGFDPTLTLALGVNLSHVVGAPLQALLDEINTLGITTFSLPLIDQSLEDILRIESFLTNVLDAVDALPLLTVALQRQGNGDLTIDIDNNFLVDFSASFTDVLKTSLADLLRLDRDRIGGNGLALSYATGVLDFGLDLDLLIDESIAIDIDLAQLLSDFAAGVSLDDFLQLEASADLGIAGAAGFNLNFMFELERQLFGTLGTDPAIVIGDTGLEVDLSQFGANDINALAAIDIPDDFTDGLPPAIQDIINELEGLAKVRIDDGFASFLVADDTDPARDFKKLFSFDYSEATGWTPTLNAGFSLDLPVFIADGLRLTWPEKDDLGNVVGTLDSISLTGSFTGTDLSSFSITPPELPKVSEISDQIKLMLLINSPGYLVSAVDQISSLFDKDDPNSVFNQLLGSGNGDGGLIDQLTQLEIPVVGDVVGEIADALGAVIGEVTDGFTAVLAGIAAGFDALGIDENTTLDELIQDAIVQMFAGIEDGIGLALDALGISVTIPRLLSNLNISLLDEYLVSEGSTLDDYRNYVVAQRGSDFSAISDDEFDQLLADFLIIDVMTLQAGIAAGIDINRNRNFVRVSEEDLAAGRLEFEFQLGLDIFEKDVPIDFEAAVPGLPLKLEVGDNSEITLRSGLTLDLGFGFDVTADSLADFIYVATDKGGVFEDTPSDLGDYGEFKFTVAADLGDQFNAMAQLGFLQAAVGYDLDPMRTDTDGIDGFVNTLLNGSIIVDLLDSAIGMNPADDNMLSLGDLGSFSVANNLRGVAQINAQSDLRARLGIGTALGDIDYSGDIQNFDGVDGLIIGGGVDVHYRQQFVRALFGELPSGLESGAELIFENLHLDVGFLADLIGPVLDAINEYIAPPVNAIADLLDLDIDLLGDIGLVQPDQYSGTAIGDVNTTELVDVLVLVADLLSAVPDPRARAAGTAIDALVQLVGLAKTVVDIAEQLKGAADQGVLNFGTLRMGDQITSDADLKTMLGLADSANLNDEIWDIQTQIAKPADGSDIDNDQLQRDLDSSIDNANKGAFDGSTNNDLNLPSAKPDVEVSFTVDLPILKSPKSALNLILGKPTDLVTFAFDFSLSFGAETEIVLGGPLYGLFDMGFLLAADIDAGFNTRGIADTLSNLTVGQFPTNADFLLDGLLEGLYFDDHIVNGVDNPEIYVDAKLLAGIGAGIPGLVEAEVFGGVTGELNIDWADDRSAGTDTPGRLYLDELIDTVSSHGLECIFDIDGSLDAELGWSIWVGLDTGFFTVTLFEDGDVFVRENIATFIHTCNNKSPALASLDNNGELKLNIGDRASFRASEQFKPDGAPADQLFNDYDPNDAEFANTIRSTSSSYAVAYKVYEDTHDFNDGIDGNDLDAIVVESEGIKQYFLKSDVSSITGTGNGSQTVFDENGNPIGTRGDLILLDLDAPDIDVNITGGDEADQFRADGNYGSVVFNGGAGNDVLIGSDSEITGSETLRGGEGNDQIAGRAGDDLLIGGVGDDTIAGGAGNDTIWGYNENNAGSLGTDTDRDRIRGDGGQDSINAGPQNDIVTWVKGDGNDTLVSGGDAAEQDALNLIAYTVDRMTGEHSDTADAPTDTVTLSKNGSSIVLNWSSADGIENYIFDNFSSINLDVGAGEDAVVVDDLSNTTVGAVNVDLGGTNTLRTQSVWLNANGDVIRYAEDVKALHQVDVFDETAVYQNDTFARSDNGEMIFFNGQYVEIDKLRYRSEPSGFVQDSNGGYYRTLDDDYVLATEVDRYFSFVAGEPVLLNGAGTLKLDGNNQETVIHQAGDIVRDRNQAERIAAGNLFGVTTAAVTSETRLVATRQSDGALDSLTFIGSELVDGVELFSKRNLYYGDVDYGLEWKGVVNNPGFSEDLVLNVTGFDASDRFIVDTAGGDDIIDARGLQDIIPAVVDTGVDNSAVLPEVLMAQQLALTLYGNSGNDRILGSRLVETIVGGSGADVIYGNEGVDSYSSSLFPEQGDLVHEHIANELQIDTFVAQRDVDFKLTDTEVHIGAEVEQLDNLFESVLLIGGDSRNTFTIGRIGDTATATDIWRYDLIVDGGAQADTYDLWLGGFGRPEGILDSDPAAENRLYDGGSNTGPDGQFVFDALGLNDQGLSILGANAGLVYRGGKDQGLDLRTDVLTINTGETDDTFHFNAVDKQGRELAGYNADGKQVDANGDLLDLDGYVERIDATDDLAATFQSINADEIAENLDTIDDSIANPDIRGVDVAGDILKQRVYYNSAEKVIVHGWGGDDLFIVDNNTEKLEVFGDIGEDSFFIGNVIRTTEWVPPGQTEAIDVIDGETGISDGISVQSEFHGGEQDDYFEVNHNRARLSLYGENGDDTFFLRAHLVESGAEVDSELISASAGDSEGNVADSDNDALVNYLRNNEVDIIGGGGFDTLIIAGTAIADDFYVFTEVVDGVEVQRIYGAGLNVARIESVERLMILTAGGDDNIYLYGTLSGQELLINTGGGDDNIFIGGDAQPFTIDIPAATNVEEVPLFEQVRDFADGFDLNAFFDYYTPIQGYQNLLPNFELPVGEQAIPPEILQEWFDFFGQFWYFSAIGWAYNFQYLDNGFSSFVDLYENVILSRFYNDPNAEAVEAAFTQFTSLALIEPIPQYNIEIPAFTLDLTTPEIRDLGSIAGPVRLTDIGGNDSIYIDNSLADDGAENLVLSNRLVEKAEFVVEDDAGILNTLFAGDERVSAGYINLSEIAGDLLSQIRRDNQVKNPGLVTRMLNGDDADTESVVLAAGQQIYNFESEAAFNAYIAQFDELSPPATSALNDAVVVYKPVPSRQPENLVAVFNYQWDEPPAGYTQTDPNGQLLSITVTDTADVNFSISFVTDQSASALEKYENWRRDAANQIDPLVNYYSYSRVENGQLLASWVYQRTANTDENGRSTGGFEDQLLFAFKADNFAVEADSIGLVANFDEAGVDAFIKAAYGVQVRPQANITVDPPEWPKIYEAKVADSNGDKFKIEVVGSANSQTPDDIVIWSVYASDILILDVPNAFVTGVAVDDQGEEIPWVSTPNDTLIYDYDDGTIAETRSIYYAGFEVLDLQLGDVDNLINVESTAHLQEATIRTAGGNDVVHFGEVIGQTNTGFDIETLAGIDSNILIDGGNDANSIDLIEVSAKNNSDAQVGRLDATSISGFGMGAVLSYQNIDYLDVITGSAADQVTIAGTHQDVLTFVNTGDDNDEVLVENAIGSSNDVRGEVRINVGAGDQNRLEVIDTGDQTGDDIELNIEDGIVSPLDNSDALFGRITGLSEGTIYYRSDDDGAFNADDGLVIRGTSGDDTILVNNLYRSNHTEVFAGRGDDTVVVDAFDLDGRQLLPPELTIYGESGSDYIDASLSPVFVTLYGNLPQQNVAAGQADQDTLIGSELNDIIEGNGGDDIIIGNLGDDTIDAGDGNDIVLGDRGTVVMANPLGAGENGEPVSVSSTDIENGGDDTINGGAGDDVIIAGQGEDTVDGGAGNDGIVGDVGIARFASRSLSSIEASPVPVGAVDNITGGPGEDTLIGGEGDDVFNADFRADTIIGYFGRVRFDDVGNVISVIILGVDGQDLVATELGNLYVNPATITSLARSTAVSVANDGSNLAIGASINAALFDSADLSTNAAGSTLDSGDPGGDDYVIDLGLIGDESQAGVPLGSYRVTPGDTLSDIMRAFDLQYPVDIQQVLDFNGFIRDPNYIQAGWQIKLLDIEAFPDELSDELPDELSDKWSADPSASIAAPLGNQQASSDAEQPADAIGLAVAAMMGWKVHSNASASNPLPGAQSLDRSALQALDNTARKRRFARWDGQRVVGGKP